MGEDFVSFSLAKKLKEKGFPQYTEKSYFVGDHKKRMCSVGTFLHVHTQNTEHLIAAPTISQVLKWLREEKGVYVNASTFANHKKGGYFWGCEVYDISEMPIIVRYKHSIFEKGNYKEAILAGIEYCLDNLI